MPGDTDGYLVKSSSQGIVQWAQAGGGAGADYWNNLALDASGAPYVLGNFSATAQFGGFSLSSLGGYDIAVASYTPQGQVRWAQQAGSVSGIEFAYYLGLDARGDAYVFGDFTSSCTFGSIPLTSSNTSTPTAFIARLGSSVLAAQAARTLELSVAPNPATEFVKLTGVAAGSSFQFLDILGRIVRQKTVLEGELISVADLPTGIYVARVVTAQGQVYTSRLAVE